MDFAQFKQHGTRLGLLIENEGPDVPKSAGGLIEMNKLSAGGRVWKGWTPSKEPLNDQNAWQPSTQQLRWSFSFFPPSLSFSRGSVYPGRVALNPGAFVVLRLAVASANVNANEMNAVPLPVDTLKKNSAKKRGGGARGEHNFIFGQDLCIYLWMHPCTRENKDKKNNNKKTGKRTTRVAKSGNGAETTSMDSATLARKLGDEHPIGAYWKAFFPEDGWKEQNYKIKN